MDVFECITTRRSIRKYKEVPVEWDKVGQILEAGRAAPSSGNVQNWKFIVVLDKPLREGLAEASFQQYWMIQAPVHIVIVEEPLKVKRHYGLRGEKLYSIQNCAAAAENMLLTAHSLGLGACWIGAFDEERVRRLLKIVDEARPQAIITVGYADEIPPAPPKFKMDNVAYINQWWGRIKDMDQYLGYTSAVVLRTVDKGKDILRKINKKLRKEK